MAVSPVHAQELFEDVARYESFGVHRYGSPGAEAALDWIAEELGKAGLKVTQQRFTLTRQYDLQHATLALDGNRLDVLPQWWIPESQATFSLTAPIAADGFARVTLPFDRGAYLNDSHRAKLAEAFERRPRAVLLTIDHPSNEIFTYNVDQASRPWPAPVILVAPKDRSLLDAAEHSGHKLTLDVSGRYRRNVESRNIVARLDRGKGKWLVISTPVTSWFTSTCERGPGIAGFLALARISAQNFTDVDLAFVATSGHEIGHGGMEHFLREGAPPPAITLAWAHFGSSLACRDTVVRAINSSTSLSPQVDRHFAAIDGERLNGERAAIGELREVCAAGYAGFFGMAGSHRCFHTPVDDISGIAKELLAPMVNAFAGTLAEAAIR